jgi:hypothetical protein
METKLSTANNMNTPQNDGGAAFPSKMLVNRFATEETAQQLIGADGMTLRDWFAGQAVSGLYADHQYTGSHVEAAKCCYALADAMLTARNERQEL